MNIDALIVIIVLIIVLISLYFELLGTAFTFLIAVAILGVFGILTPNEIISGFSNEQIAVIVMLLILGDVIRRSSVVEYFFNNFFKRANTYNSYMRRMMVVVGFFSAFVNNTPLVAIMMPYVHNWSKRHKIAPSKLLIPLSYAAILGGSCTLIGTSTNLIVSGFVIDQNIIKELKPLDLFDFVYVGLPMLIIGFIYILTIGKKLLPSNTDILSEVTNSIRQYLFETEVRKHSHLIGKTIKESDLLNLEGLSLFKIIRNNYNIISASGDTKIEESDRFIFSGEKEIITDLINKQDSGFTFPLVGMLSKKNHTDIIEIVISHNSTLITKKVKEINFRKRYNSGIIAIHRNGENISQKIEDIRLKAGDVLLLLTDNDLVSRDISQDFYFISKVKEISKPQLYKTIALIGGTALAILLSALGLVPLFIALLLLLILLFGIKIASPKDIHKNLDFNLIFIIALSLAFGTAMIKTGVAGIIADLLINIFIPFGTLSILFGIYFVTTILAAYITNKAAVAITFPIALTMAVNLNLNPMPFILIVAFAAAANFMTPIGYQTNIMVYGPGGYKFRDFFRIGFPLTIIYMIVTVLILYFMYF
ncbi:MAG: SLC13 family permease [Bacteroidetes bacterium]|nr:MAG: SLC13 family permease [Bacteroidota bacterium]